jgi:hypothetical protein
MVSIANFLDKEDDENEDYISVHEIDNKNASFILSDGAGGSGVFSKEWAQYLGDNTPNIPFVSESDSKEWFYKTATGFHDTVILNKQLTDLILSKKIYRDGSYATFCACWLDIKENSLTYSVIGDSFLFIFSKCENVFIIKEIAPIQNQQNFDENPELLNWLDENQVRMPIKKFEIVDESIIMQASDGLAKWIILNLILLDAASMSEIGVNQSYLNSLSQEKNLLRKESLAIGSGIKSVNELLLFLKEISTDKYKFTSAMKDLYENREIEIDDYSLIYIGANVS